MRLQQSSKEKSWIIRVLRYSESLPEVFFKIDPSTVQFKSSLKLWIKENIPKNGDFIFRGKCKPDQTDWLLHEVREWKRRIDHDYNTEMELRMLQEQEHQNY